MPPQAPQQDKAKSPAPPPPKKPGFRMPKPGAVVIWRHVIGGDPSPAVVTKLGRQGISVMVFPPDSRVGIPKDGVRHISDPQVKTQVMPESGIWDHTDETKLLLALARNLVDAPGGGVDPITDETVQLLASYC